MRTRLATVFVLALATSCSADDLVTEELAQTSSAQCSAWGGTYSGVSFADEQATHAIDLAENGTALELEGLHGVGPRIAADIVAGRPYANQADPLGALDAIPRIGKRVLRSFRDQSFNAWCAVDDGRQSCCFELACDAGGAVSGVEFSDGQARQVLAWANFASAAELVDACGVGSTIATNIEAARPLHNLSELDAVSYVGSTLLHRLLGDPGYTCEQGGGPVEESWCADHDCTCPAPPSGVSCDVPTEYETLDELNADPPLRIFVEELIAQGNPCAPDNPNPLVPTIVEVCLAGSANYVELVQQQTDSVAEANEGPFHLYYEFDDALQITSSSCEPSTPLQTTVEEYVCDQGIPCVHDLDPQLGAAVDQLATEVPKCEENIIFPVVYSYMNITSVDGTPTQYEVNFVQWIDPEGGIQCWISYTLDSSYNRIAGPDFLI